MRFEMSAPNSDVGALHGRPHDCHVWSSPASYWCCSVRCWFSGPLCIRREFTLAKVMDLSRNMPYRYWCLHSPGSCQCKRHPPCLGSPLACCVFMPRPSHAPILMHDPVLGHLVASHL